MGMLVFEILAVVLGIAITYAVGTQVVRSVKGANRLAEEARSRRGRLNAEKLDSELKLVCSYCAKAVDPNTDVLVKGVWWHYGCFKELIQ